MSSFKLPASGSRNRTMWGLPALVLISAVGLTACGSGPDPGTTPTTTSTVAKKAGNSDPSALRTITLTFEVSNPVSTSTPYCLPDPSVAGFTPSTTYTIYVTDGFSTLEKRFTTNGTGSANIYTGDPVRPGSSVTATVDGTSVTAVATC